MTVKGIAADQENKEKILLCCGNVHGVSKVVDQITVEKQEPEAKYYTAKSGDTLSKISKAEKLANAGVEVVGSSPEQFAAIIKSEIARNGKVIKEAAGPTRTGFTKNEASRIVHVQL